MSRSSGTYTAPSNSWNPAVEGTVVDETDWNAILDDLEAGLTESVYTGGLGATDNRLLRTDGTDTKKAQGSAVTVDDSGNISGVGTLASGAITSTGAVTGTALSASTSGVTTTGTIELGHASDTTLARSGAGDVTIEGNAIYRASGADVAIADGGTGASTAAAGARALLEGLSSTQGEILYRNASQWVALGVGASGEVLQSGGAGANVAWAAVAGTGDVTAASSFGTDNVLVRADGTGKGVQSSGIVIDDSNNLSVPGRITRMSRPLSLPPGRLTLSTGVPVLSSSVAAAGTLYYAPYVGGVLWLYDGSAGWDAVAFTELSVVLSGGTASRPHDVFVYNNAGTATLELTAWTNSTTRATALTTQDGLYVKSGATTRLYLGTIYLNASTQCDFILGAAASGGTAGVIGLWNMYQRGPWTTYVADTTDSWAYATGSWRAANNSSTMRTSFVCGLSEGVIQANYQAVSIHTGNAGRVAIGYDSTTSPAGPMLPASTGDRTLADTVNSTVIYSLHATLGYHYLAPLEYGSANVTFYGDAGLSTFQSGFIARGEF